MSLVSSLYAGATGLDSNSLDLTVIGDNIANGNTIGFKGSRAVFSDALSQSLMGAGGDGASQMGLGTQLSGIQKIFTQGSLLNTGVTTDLAIQGNGMFMVRGSHQGVEGTYFTRAGQFIVDKDGFLTNTQGLKVQGYGANVQGVVGADLRDMQPGIARSPPKATSQIVLKANLQADAEEPFEMKPDANGVLNKVVVPWDPQNPAASSNFSTSTTIFDSLGVKHQVDVYFRKEPTGEWKWHALTDGGGVEGGTSGIREEIAGGTLRFDEEGNIAEGGFTQEGGPFKPRGAREQPLAFSFGDKNDPGVTQFASPSAATFINQDGFASGDLSTIQVDPTGVVQGVFTNGQTRPLGQIALANFPAPDKLERAGSNLYGATVAAGDPIVGKPSSGGRGSITSGALEQSNVDLSSEFIRMIASQRSFQANSKTINTADALLTEIINLKR